MQVERLLALVEDASVSAFCEIVWCMSADAVVDMESRKRPMAAAAVGALSEVRQVTVREFGCAASLKGVRAASLLGESGPRLVPSTP